MELKNKGLVEFVKKFGEEKVRNGFEKYLRSRERSERLRVERKSELEELREMKKMYEEELEMMNGKKKREGEWGGEDKEALEGVK